MRRFHRFAFRTHSKPPPNSCGFPKPTSAPVFWTLRECLPWLVRENRIGSAHVRPSLNGILHRNSMSNITQRLLVLSGMTSDRNTVLKFCEPKGTPRHTLFDRLL